MDQQWKEKWIAALRSGEYEQCSVCLVNLEGTKHCCLGVLQAIRGLNLAKGSPEYSYPDDLLTQEQQWALIRKNDSGTPFSAIADYIEAHL